MTQSLLLILKSANCLRFCIQWYAHELNCIFASGQETLDIMQIATAKGSQFPAMMKELGKSRPNEGMLDYLTMIDDAVCGLSIFFPLLYYLGGEFSSIYHFFGVFHKFCMIQWFLHVRDQTSHYLRKLQPSLQKIPV